MWSGKKAGTLLKNILRVGLLLVIAHTVFWDQEPLQAARRKLISESSTPKKEIPVIWRDPGAVEELDFALGPGGVQNIPKPPFSFVKEDLKGSNPKITVTDKANRLWTIKFGPEAHAESFAARIVWAAGYFVEPNYWMASGRIEGVKNLTRAKSYVTRNGIFTNGRFELKKQEGLHKLDEKKSWNWNSNPFIGTKEFNGLKVVMMLLSNFDNKDARDLKRGSNTAIFLHPVPGGIERRYAVTDWGGSMGKWGGYLSRHRWDCRDYAKQTPDFVKGLENGFVEWGWSGQHTRDLTEKIPVADVKWLLQYLGRITDQQLHAGLKASGATPEEVQCFATAVRDRIRRLQQLTQ